jgi:sugar phosphate isomerase/epimerase
VQIDVGTPGSDYYLGNPEVLDAYRRFSEKSKVAIVGIGAKFVNDLGMTSNEGTQADRNCQALIATAINAAIALGTHFVFFPSFRKSEICGKEDLFNTARLLKQACIQAAPYGIEIGSENSLGCEGNRKLIEMVGEPNFRILIDTYNPVIFGHSVSCILQELTPYISNQVHVKDGIGGRMGSAPLGAGEGRFFETIKTLKTLDFDGMILLENKYLVDTERRVAEDLAVLARLFDIPNPMTTRNCHPNDNLSEVHSRSTKSGT